MAVGLALQEQHDGLRAAGSDQIQGYYYSNPLSPEDCAGYLREHAAPRPPAPSVQG
jgi:EAL domain-containing protein (putative c-di-GMP-specific phosphodiesterase class I)